MAPVGQALAGQLPPQAVIYRDTCCHRNDPTGASLAHLSCDHASTGWGEAPLGLRLQIVPALTRGAEVMDEIFG
jgi:hypothetical protein